MGRSPSPWAQPATAKRRCQSLTRIFSLPQLSRQLGAIGVGGRLSARKIGAGIGLYAGAGKYYSAQAATPAYVTRDPDNLGAPSDRFTVNADFKSGPFTLGYRLRWFARQYVGDYSFYNSLNGNAPTDPYYANYKFYPVVAYHDLRLGVDATSKFNFYLGVTNLGNKHPPLDLTGLGAGSGQCDVLGRFIYAGVVAKF